MWEEDPPYAAFGARAPDQSRRPGPRCANPLWLEVAMQAVKDLDDWTEKRRRIGRTQANDESSPEAAAESTKAAKRQAGKAEGKGKGKKADA